MCVCARACVCGVCIDVTAVSMEMQIFARGQFKSGFSFLSFLVFIPPSTPVAYVADLVVSDQPQFETERE